MSTSLALTESSVLAALAGGALIGGAASLLLSLSGRVAGVSGILSGLLSRDRGEVAWRVCFVGGLLLGGLLFAWLRPDSVAVASAPSIAVTLAGGLLVGVGTRLAGGC